MSIPEQRLWQGVVLLALSDATVDDPGSRDMARARDEARTWITRAGRDYRMVCALAGWDPEFIRDSFVSGRVDHLRLKSAGASGPKSTDRQPRPAGPLVCAVPGCEATLYDRNRTGLCGVHVHAVGYCQCSQCRSG